MQQTVNESIYTKRERLSGALKVQKQIDQLRDKLKDLKENGGIQGVTLSDMPRGGETLSVFDMIAEIQGDIDRLEDERNLEAQLVQRQIGKYCLEEREEKLLTLRYVKCYRWKTVYTLLGISKPTAHRMDNRIFENLAL